MDFCCISHKPFDIPYMDQEGNVYELEEIAKFLKLFKKNPVSGKPMEAKELIKLNFAKNTNDNSNDEIRFQCPALFRPFTKNSHIVAIATTGNVYCNEAVEQLNIKTKNWKDLVNDQPFTRKDIITIQDPSDIAKFDISRFHFVRNRLKVKTEEEKAEERDASKKIKTMSHEGRAALDELEKTYKEKEDDQKKDTKNPDKFNAAHYSTGKVAASFTSTAIAPETNNQVDIIHEDIVRYERVKKKGYLRLNTNFGPLNLELFCDQLPKTCENFMKHCISGYYTGTKFHRSIRNFMIQGGDPLSKTGKSAGRGGTSIWGTKFEDEFKPNLSHSGRGILSMANSGPNTNGSQFFITFRSCKHLDGKHTIFGKIVGGFETLNEMEKIEVDNKDEPIEDIVIQSIQIFVDPYQEADDELKTERQAEIDKAEKEKADEKERKNPTKKNQLKVYREGVGKYLAKVKPPSTSTSSSSEPASKKKKVSSTFTNFSSW